MEQCEYIVRTPSHYNSHSNKMSHNVKRVCFSLVNELKVSLGITRTEQIMSAIERGSMKEAFDFVEAVYDSIDGSDPKFDRFNDLMGALDDLAIAMEDNNTT